jgi:hypothetical protein
MPRSPIDQRQKSLKDGTAWRFEHLSLFNRYFAKVARKKCQIFRFSEARSRFRISKAPLRSSIYFRLANAVWDYSIWRAAILRNLVRG